MFSLKKEKKEVCNEKGVGVGRRAVAIVSESFCVCENTLPPAGAIEKCPTFQWTNCFNVYSNLREVLGYKSQWLKRVKHF